VAKHALTAAPPVIRFLKDPGPLKFFADGTAVRSADVQGHQTHLVERPLHAAPREYLRPDGKMVALQSAVSISMLPGWSLAFAQGVCAVRQARACSAALGNTAHRRIDDIIAHHRRWLARSARTASSAGGVANQVID
jgi:hypothetical protein